jgi:hypothetical protein
MQIGVPSCFVLALLKMEINNKYLKTLYLKMLRLLKKN